MENEQNNDFHISSCCHAEAVVVGDVTKSYRCRLCLKPCDSFETKKRIMPVHGEFFGYKWLIKQNRELGHFLAYIQLGDKHPLALFAKKGDYNAISNNIECHGGFTFATRFTRRDKEGIALGFTPGNWIGWDYAHAGDYLDYPIPFAVMNLFNNDHRWTFGEVLSEVMDVINQLAEKYPQ